MKLMDALTFNDQGLIPVIIANVEDGRPLTLCYMNREAMRRRSRPARSTSSAARRAG